MSEAIVTFDPETAARQAVEALETRHATITPGTTVGAALATGRLDAILDAADALDLDAALADLAADLGAAGDESPLDVRRAKALGLLARGETPDLPDGVEPRRRQVVLHLHLDAADMTATGLAKVCSDSGQPLGLAAVAQVQDWCRGAGQVTVKPVLDLAETIRCSGYQPSARLRDQVVAINPTCVFPHCHRPAAKLDLDHIEPYDPDNPAAQTTSVNLAPLCRRHHRAKTFGGWRYRRIGPGRHHWTSPHGYQWITDTTGTRDGPIDQ